ncbi:phosphoglycerate dehydrogenase [Anoxybacillus ayderensis]|uniref:phosphoglycerate dehydrogenase n=1 Tax=Anoxybacillus sp. ST70 TaxID=2864180 RepID=UPI0002D8ABE5|nr:phosphoglycerate dehydrogenase [Anoxybacillus ayderensis G10]MBW9218117.1 phosphoglycerate dehydrogenase [Anoxybacillus sp. ST70]THD17382.1 phosphoglycerate dehydrogenase [Anoxybacillus ayderensis]
MVRILVSDAMSEEGLAPLLADPTIEVVQKKVSEVENELDTFDALLVRSATKVTEQLLQNMPNLKIVGRAGVGVDNIDVDAATRYGVVVINAPNGNTISTAEHTFAMMASLVRRIPQAHISVKSREWNRSAFVGVELFGKHLGIIGFGRIGSEVAKRARAFGMHVHVYDPFLTKARAEKIGVDVCTLDELLAQADIITVHTPLTKETKGLLGPKNLAKTKKGVYLINCARGGIIDEQALVSFLENGHVAGVALDVFEQEPPGDHPLLSFDNVIVTPHLGASTIEAQVNVATQVAEEVLKFLQGKPVTSSINLPTLSKDVYEKIQAFYTLARKMGIVASQYMSEPVQEIAITYSGSVADLETTFITRSLLAGFLKPRVASTVNEVNAAMIAKERGIAFSEKFSANGNDYNNSITLTVYGENKTFTMKGTHIAHYGDRIVHFNGFAIDFAPEGHLLYIQHHDKPGMIGKVGNILGDHQVNIATMQVGRQQAGGKAIMMLSLDKPLDDALVEILEKIDDIDVVKRLEV